MNNEIRPVKFPEANGTLCGTGDVKDLPVCHTVDGNVTSCWYIPWWKRVKLLLTGKIYLVVKGRTHPPLWIDTKAFERSK